MSDIANYIKAYIAKSGASFDEVKGKLKEFQGTFRNDNTRGHNLDCIFKVEEDTNLSSDEFLKIVKTASPSGLSEFNEDDIQMFLDLIDKNDDGYYSADELGQFALKGSNIICSQSIWNGILCGDLKESDVLELESDSDVSGTVDDGETTVGESTGTGTTVGAGIEDTTTVDENVEEATDTEAETDEDTPSYTNSEISKLKEKINSALSGVSVGSAYTCPEDIISHWEKTGKITEEMADILRVEYTEYDEEDENTITQIMNVDGVSRIEAIEIAEKQGLLKDPISSPNDSLKDIEKSQGDYVINVDRYAKDLHDAFGGHLDGTDEDTLISILEDEDISDDDFVAIIKKYEELYGVDNDSKGFVTMIEKETSNTDSGLEDRLTKKLADRLISAAMNGNEDAIDMLCKEIYSGTAGQNNTANKFLETVFGDNSQLSDKLIAKIAERYSVVNSGRDLINDIKKDYDGINLFGWHPWSDLFGYGEADKFIANIKEAQRKYAK